MWRHWQEAVTLSWVTGIPRWRVMVALLVRDVLRLFAQQSPGSDIHGLSVVRGGRSKGERDEQHDERK